MIKVIKNQSTNDVTVFRNKELVATFAETEMEEILNQLNSSLAENTVKHPPEYVKISLEDLRENAEKYSYKWEDIRGFDFCVNRMEHFYPNISSEARVVFEKEIEYSDGYHVYKRDFDWLFKSPRIEKNFYKHEVWDQNEVSLENVLNCLDDELISYVLHNENFHLFWDGEEIEKEEILTYYNEKNSWITFSFGSSYNT